MDCADLDPHTLVAWIFKFTGSQVPECGFKLRLPQDYVWVHYTDVHTVHTELKGTHKSSIIIIFYIFWERNTSQNVIIHAESSENNKKNGKETYNKINKHPLVHSLHLKQISVAPKVAASIRACLMLSYFMTDNKVDCHSPSVKTEWKSMHNSISLGCRFQDATLVCGCNCNTASDPLSKATTWNCHLFLEMFD